MAPVKKGAAKKGGTKGGASPKRRATGGSTIVPALQPADGTAALVKPKTRRGKRALERRAPKLVEDAKRALFLTGGSTSAVIKDVLTDLHKLKGVRLWAALGQGTAPEGAHLLHS
jgi:hypothetical protein